MAKVDEWLTEENLILLEGWARDGLTIDQIAHNCGVVSSTLREWKKKKQAISEALKKGKDVADYQVENALFKKATGYIMNINEEKLDRDGEIHTITKQIYIQPDTQAAIYWLKNRKRDKWSDKPLEESNEGEGVIIVNDLPKDGC